jgi:hypothetical protein
MNKEIEIKKEVSPLVAKAQAVTIMSADDMKEATVLLSVVNKKLDAITAEEEKVTKPLNEALKAERARWSPMKTILKDAVSVLRTKMSAYQTAETKRAQEEKARIASRIGDGKGKIKMETAVRKLDEVDSPDTKVQTDAGALTFRATPTLKITDTHAIPREYLVVDEKKLLDALKAGVSVPGAEIEVIQVPVNRR